MLSQQAQPCGNYHEATDQSATPDRVAARLGCHELRRLSPALAWDKEERLRQTGVVTQVLCPVVVGRALEVRALESALEGALAGRGGCVVITGEAGIGKSRLLRELAAGWPPTVR